MKDKVFVNIDAVSTRIDTFGYQLISHEEPWNIGTSNTLLLKVISIG